MAFVSTWQWFCRPHWKLFRAGSVTQGSHVDLLRRLLVGMFWRSPKLNTGFVTHAAVTGSRYRLGAPSFFEVQDSSQVPELGCGGCCSELRSQGVLCSLSGAVTNWSCFHWGAAPTAFSLDRETMKIIQQSGSKLCGGQWTTHLWSWDAWRRRWLSLNHQLPTL